MVNALLKLKVFLVVLALGFPGSALSAQVYRIELENDRTRLRVNQGLAVKVSDNHFVTDNEIIKNAQRVYILDDASGAVTKVLARTVFTDEKKRIALLEAGNIIGSPVTFALNDQYVQGEIQLKTPSGDKKGVVNAFDTNQNVATGTLYRHSALYQANEWAAALFNNCNEFLGISLYETTRRLGSRIPKVPDSSSYASSLKTLKPLLVANNITVNVAENNCLSTEEQRNEALEESRHQLAEAQRKADEAAAEAARINALLEETRMLEEEARRRLEHERQEAERRAQEAQEQQEQINREREQEEEQFRENERALNEAAEQARLQSELAMKKQQQYKLLVVIGVALFLLAMVLFYIALSKRRTLIKRKEAELKEKNKKAEELARENNQLSAEAAIVRKTFPNIIFQGENVKGERITVKVNGRALAQEGSAIIGRDASKVNYVIDEDYVSRVHVKLSLSNDKLFIEDSDSSNGTELNHVKLKPHDKQVLLDGHKIKIGSILFNVIIKE